ncbi:MAG: hypothetical protein QOG62_1118 [Thermoleophilaceae bacterium]|nr:hypothetical protein [Thermoleophilaceae bacterium]
MDKRAQVEAVLTALDGRDFDALAEMPFHPDMQLRSVVAAVEGGVFFGLQGLREWAENVDATFDDFRVHLVELREVSDDRAFVEVHNSGTASGSSVPVDAPTYLVCTWRNGLMWRIDSYTDRDKALEAVGLSE